MKNSMRKIGASFLLICVFTVSLTIVTFGQGYIYLETGPNPRMIPLVRGWNKYVSDHEHDKGKTYWYYGDQNADMVHGWKQINGKWYAFKSNTVLQDANVIAAEAIYADGSMFANGTYPLYDASRSQRAKDAVFYSFSSDGAMVTGWFYNQKNKCWYYHDSSGKAVEGWRKINGTWYFFNHREFKIVYGSVQVPAGYEMRTGWLNDGGKWYYLNSSGAMTTGWQKIGGKWYYMNSSGVMQTGWQKIGGSWFYLEASGSMLTGWLNQNGTWYYMNGSGVMLTGWQNIGGTWYYFKPSGAMAANEWCGGYWLNADGAWANP